VVRIAALLLLSCATIAVAGCSGGEGASPTELRLEREDLVTVAHALQRAQATVSREVAATKAAWPLVAHGLPANTAAVPRSLILAAASSAARLVVPGPLQEEQSTSLTGPGAQLSGFFMSYSRLASHGWEMIDSAIEAIEHGSPAAARFARANIALYIESVYDAHFTLAQIGKQLKSGYRNLGDGKAFGVALAANEVDALAASYSEPAARLHPHVRVRLGS
jgi:hypothetical protein